MKTLAKIWAIIWSIIGIVTTGSWVTLCVWSIFDESMRSCLEEIIKAFRS